MLTLLKKIQKKGEKIVVDSDENKEGAVVEVPEPINEDALKRSIASKLQGYQPVEREANFTGPKYYS